jgi:uncharacterized protein YceK
MVSRRPWHRPAPALGWVLGHCASASGLAEHSAAERTGEIAGPTVVPPRWSLWCGPRRRVLDMPTSLIAMSLSSTLLGQQPMDLPKGSGLTTS